MQVGIDANWLIYEQAGIGKYSYYLTKEILKYDKKNEYVLFANFVRNYELRKSFLEKIVKESGNKKTEIYISKIPSQWRDWITQMPIPLKLIYNKPIDLYYSSYFGGIARNGFKKQIVTIHDLVFLKYPEHVGKKLSNYYYKRTKIATQKSDLIIAVSDSTKKDLVDLMDVMPNKIEVIYEGADKKLFYNRNKLASESHLKKYGINKPFILSVCTLEPRKNLEKLIDAYNLLDIKILNHYQLVLVGKNGWNNNLLLAKIKELERKNRVITTGYVPDEDLPYFYSGAEVFVYPSLYEGFGLPPLEAMACGCPVIVSNNSSLPEVVYNAGILIDPSDINQLSRAIYEVLSDKRVQEELGQKGLKQSEKFDWEFSAKKLSKFFNL